MSLAEYKDTDKEWQAMASGHFNSIFIPETCEYSEICVINNYLYDLGYLKNCFPKK